MLSLLSRRRSLVWLTRKLSATVSERIRLRSPTSKTSMTLRVVWDSGLCGFVVALGQRIQAVARVARGGIPAAEAQKYISRGP